VVALRDALRGGLSISAAVVRARADLEADAASLVRALLAYDADAADRAIETALALRSVERSVEEVLLPSLQQIVARAGRESAVWAFVARWMSDWLGRARRLAAPPDCRLSVMLGDALGDELDLDAPYVRALELFCVRAGISVLSLPVHAVNGLGDAAAVHRPHLVVLAGGQLPDGLAARWSSVITRSVGPIPFAFFRSPFSPASSTVLPAAPGEALVRLEGLAHTALVSDGIRPLERWRGAIAVSA
jgi:hypothetical protein